MRKIEENSKCEHSECDEKATDIVYSRILKKVLLCCELHADVIQDEDMPEYWHSCENCNCRLPIN